MARIEYDLGYGYCECDVKDGRFHGYGKQVVNGWYTYEGYFNYGRFHGKGIFKHINGDIYEGDFVRGRMHGKGVLKFKNGDIYGGEFVGNEKQGYGTMYYADGRIVNGEWKNDKLVSTSVIEDNEKEPPAKEVSIESANYKMLNALSEIFRDGIEEIEKTDNFETLIDELALTLIEADENGTRATALESVDKLLKEIEIIKLAAKRVEIQLTKLNDDDYCNLKKKISDGSEGK